MVGWTRKMQSQQNNCHHEHNERYNSRTIFIIKYDKINYRRTTNIANKIKDIAEQLIQQIEQECYSRITNNLKNTAAK